MTILQSQEELQVMNAVDKSGRLKSAEAAGSLCASLMETTAELVRVLERETSLLRTRQTDELQALQLKKQALSTTLTRNLSILKANADYIKMAVPEQLEELKEQQKQFHRSLEANHDALSAMKAVSEQLIEVIAKKVNDSAGGPQTYGKEAGVSTAQPHQPSAITYDAVL